MIDMQVIMAKYEEFNRFLETVDLEEMKKTYSRTQLKEFSKQLYNVKTRSLSYEISKIADEMKLQEFPQLLGVHRFPVIQEMDFLTDTQKIELDKFLGTFRKGNYVNGLWRIVKNTEKAKKIEQFMVGKGVFDEEFVATCPNCSDEHVSNILTKEQKEKVVEILKQVHTWERYEELEKHLYYGCNECDYQVDFETVNEDSIRFKTFVKLVAERDSSLDNV
jgi:hypothetical protein